MLAFVGLGNPGEQYAQTRHNLGFWVIDSLACELNIRLSRTLLRHCWSERVSWKEQTDLLLAKPRTYVNRSGKAVAEIVRELSVPPKQIVLIYDDLNLPLGTVRLRAKGSAGGHNGMKSIIEALGTHEFPRIRIGLGAPRSAAVWHDFVLSEFEPQEREFAEQSAETAVEAVKTVLDSSFLIAMNKFNNRQSIQTEE